MDDEPIPLISPECGQKKAADQKLGEKHGNDSKNNVSPPKSNKKGKAKSKFFDTVLGVLETIALICWILSEVFHNTFIHGFLLWLAMAFFLSGGAHLVHKASKKAGVTWLIYAVMVVLLGGAVYEGLHSEKDSSAFPSQSSAPIVDTKQQIRILLNEINPQILQMIDAGNKQIPILICGYHGEKLRNWADTADGKHYFTLQATTVTVGGIGNHIDNYLNDQDNSGMMTGYIIFPSIALKSVPQ